ncbi:unnamed protein product [Bursaphelenchus okinawaensis]|uniref:Uncharacterized protein n=1 Tax=Bursaphelenchus okinawaensis TaxID=465554 RepID=A0A811L784_9BILA|nr:unnamed protein product [Bursaphelenchus okinawaensis]CAG9117735.1 unnamed protein product [Bursaphelenchus okinawaensis]
MIQTIVVALLVCILATSGSAKPMVSTEHEAQKLYALAELIEAEEAAHKLEQRLRQSLLHEEPATLAEALDQLNAYPQPVEGKHGEGKTTPLSLQFFEKRSKNFLKLANQAARGFGRK